MEYETNSSISRCFLVIPVSPRGHIGLDSMSLMVSMNQVFLPTYGPYHVEEPAKLNLAIPLAQHDVDQARRAEKKDARDALKTLNVAHKDLWARRDQATQRLVAAFDLAESKRLFASPVFKAALLI
jgi:hypothetical protein